MQCKATATQSSAAPKCWRGVVLEHQSFGEALLLTQLDRLRNLETMIDMLRFDP